MTDRSSYHHDEPDYQGASARRTAKTHHEIMTAKNSKNHHKIKNQKIKQKLIIQIVMSIMW